MFVKYLLKTIIILGLILNPLITVALTTMPCQCHSHPITTNVHLTATEQHPASNVSSGCHHASDNQDQTKPSQNDNQCSCDGCPNCQHCHCSFAVIQTIVQIPFIFEHPPIVRYLSSVRTRPAPVLYRPPIFIL